MYVKRDFLETLRNATALEAVLLWGPRQVGKTTLLEQLELGSSILLDDLSVRQKAQADPAFILDGLSLPCLIDEAQYASNLFPEIKLRIDHLRKEALKKNHTTKSKPIYYLTGSNRLLLDKNVKESLAGRCHIFTLHGLSVNEILHQFPQIQLKKILLYGGFPELYTRENLTPTRYLNDYIVSFIEKDIAQSSGVEKLGEFQTLLHLLAARSGHFLNMSDLSAAAGVDQKTVHNWIHILQRNHILDLVPPYFSNLSKRAIKMKKLFFYDTGLCARLQSHSDENTLWNSAQAGSLFETLVFSEIIKTRDNFLKEWKIFTWRTKEQHEIDFILQYQESFLFIEAKMGIHGAKTFILDHEACKIFKPPHQKIVVTVGGNFMPLDRTTYRVPIQQLGEYLLSRF
ncbi:MAG: ATP-binding protein [Deltaproteobacteria bacterium]|nr:ATP-binding protein [Deltaproteobacteria bacterium]